MKILNAGLLALALGASVGAAAAQQQPDARFPYDQMPTHVVGIAPPEGWRTAYFSIQGVVAELGELTPDADVHRWRDLIAYMAVATLTNQRVDDMNANLTEVRTHCASHATFDVRPANAHATDAWAAIVCLDRPGQANSLPEAPLQVYLFRSLSTNDATFRMWRAWRGAASDVAQMLARVGVTGVRRLANNPTSGQLHALFEPIIQRLADAWGAELTQALEICDLAGSPCTSLNRSVADVPAYELLTNLEQANRMAGVVSLEGDRSDMAGATQFYREVFRSDPPSTDNVSFMVALSPSTFDFRRGQSTVNLALMMFRASRGTSGLFSVSSDAPSPPPSEQARLRAYLLRVVRFAASAPEGAAYDSFRFDLWPNE